MSNRLSVAAIAAEVATDPLTVEISDGVTVDFLPLDGLPGDDVEQIVDAIASVEDRALTPGSLPEMSVVLRAMNVVIRHALTPDDAQLWRAYRVSVRAQLAVMEALTVFYAGAGTPGEGRA